MAYSPLKNYLGRKTAVWSGRARRLAKLIDVDKQNEATKNNEPAPPKTPGGHTT